MSQVYKNYKTRCYVVTSMLMMLNLTTLETFILTKFFSESEGNYVLEELGRNVNKKNNRRRKPITKETQVSKPSPRTSGSSSGETNNRALLLLLLIILIWVYVKNKNVRTAHCSWYENSKNVCKKHCFCILIMPSPFPALSSPGKAWAIKDIRRLQNKSSSSSRATSTAWWVS